jgi:hypothetical protein
VISKIGGKFPENYNLVEFSLQEKNSQKFPFLGWRKRKKMEKKNTGSIVP